MRKWVEKEGRKWVRDELISEDQYEQIVNRYKKEQTSNLLPVFASILIGLGILSFIASNWDGIHDLVRVFIIIIVMSGFYLAGERAHRNGNERIGNSLLGIGIISFGAGIFLLGQMYHFQSYDARAFIIWALAGLLVVQLWKSKFLLIVTMAIITVGQLYTMFQFSAFSYILALLLFFGVGHFVYHRPHTIISVLFSFSYSLTALFLVISEEWNYHVLFIFFLALYVMSEWLKKDQIKRPIQLFMQISAILVSIFTIFTFDSFLQYEGINTNGLTVYPFILVILFGLFYWLKKKSLDVTDLLLYLPVFYVGVMVDVLYMLLLFIYSISLLVIGYREELTEKATFGTMLFLLSAFIGYIQLAWDFMPKSIFFLLGGIILFILSWLLEKRRRQLVKGVKRHD
ncbi:putative membrane protein [Bacillus mesophilus]|uniref:DUF2157 domain-containing protein n=1 Tax=Bacillus mesophilus TaxID=1808955 RepID=A0A6M0Q6D7_9BACI|nr:DUF2157 domain-containing protein [Bacillus mesophilus]MBM7659809.1 putative membrane protein [Bacillus mesophilus]NEY70668.1 DUF2157 domain-containing protein [Bacillus mesophilus]